MTRTHTSVNSPPAHTVALHSPCRSRVAVIGLHLPGDRSVTINPMSAPQVQEAAGDCLRCTTREDGPPNASSMLAQPSSAGDVVPAGLWPSPTEPKTCASRLTTCPPPPRPTRQGARDCQDPPTLGTSALCAASLWREPKKRSPKIAAKLWLRDIVKKSCRAL